jgi:hypothetical protein
VCVLNQSLIYEYADGIKTKTDVYPCLNVPVTHTLLTQFPTKMSTLHYTCDVFCTGDQNGK